MGKRAEGPQRAVLNTVGDDQNVEREEREEEYEREMEEEEQTWKEDREGPERKMEEVRVEDLVQRWSFP